MRGGEIRELQTIYLVGSKVMLLLAMSAGLIAAVWAADFFSLLD